MTTPDVSAIPIACNLNALRAEERVRRSTLANRLWANRQEVLETATGYAVRLPDDSSSCSEAFELSLFERRCCPFLRLELTMEPNAGPVWLTLSGRPGVKAFLAASSLIGGEGSETAPQCS